MKIAMIGHKYVPSREGGVEIVVEELSSRLAHENEVTLFNRKRKQYEKISEHKGCKVKSIFTINKKSLDAIVYAFFATLKGVFGKYDVLHFHAEGPCFFLWMTRFCKKKIIVTIHGLDWQRGKWGGFASKILKTGEKRAVKYADEIIVLSKNNQKYFMDTYGRETIYIPNGIGIPVKKDADIITKEYGLQKNDYILFLARIVPEKGLDYLIEAYKNMSKEERMGKKLVIAGGSSHSDDYYNSIVEKCKDDEDIILTGFITGDKLHEAFTNTCLYVLPSDIEGMPMSLLEAMSYGKRCLVSNIPENVEVINERCVSFEKSNPHDLKEKLISMLKEGNENGLETAIMTWDDVAVKTNNLYKGVK